MFKFFIKSLRKLGLLDYLSFTLKKRINGANIQIPVINGMGIGNNLHLSEPWMNELLIRLINNDNQGIFVDIGVNLGQTLIKVKSINPAITYVGFEPNSNCNFYLNALIKKNKFKKVDIFPVGIGKETGILDLEMLNNSITDSSASIIKKFRNEAIIQNRLKVPIFAYADLNLDKSKFSIVKIDVEGAELEVIEGMQEKIKNDRPIMLVEILPVYNIENEFRLKRQRKIEIILSSIDYNIFRIIKSIDVFFDIQKITEFGIHSDLNKCDYIFVPSEKSCWLTRTLHPSEIGRRKD